MTYRSGDIDVDITCRLTESTLPRFPQGREKRSSGCRHEGQSRGRSQACIPRRSRGCVTQRLFTTAGSRALLPSNLLPYPLATRRLCDDILLFLTFRPSSRLHTQHIPTPSSSKPVNVKLDNDLCCDCVVKIASNAGERSSIETKPNHFCRVSSQCDKSLLVQPGSQIHFHLE
jgi:hypothetical protein